MMLDIIKCCEILGVSRNATYDEAKSAYRELARIYHPDKHMHNERQAARSAEKFKELLNAWNDFEVHYKLLEQIRKEQEREEQHRREREEQHRREREEQHRRERERERELALRAEEARRAEGARKALNEYTSYTCEHCGSVKKVLRIMSFNSVKCIECNKFISAEREAIEQAKLKERSNAKNINKNAPNNNMSHTLIKVISTITCFFGALIIVAMLSKSNTLYAIFPVLGLLVILLPFIFIFTGGFNKLIDYLDGNNHTS